MLGGGLPRASATVVQGGTGTGKTLARPAVPPRGRAARRAGNPLHAGGDAGPASRHRPWLRVGSPRAREARAPHLQLRLARRALDRHLPRSGAAAGGAARGATRRPRQPDEHGARRSLRAAFQGARLRHHQALPRPRASRSNMNMEIAELLGLCPALRPRGLVRRRQRDPAQVRGGRRAPRARHLGPEGARRATRNRRAPDRRSKRTGSTVGAALHRHCAAC